MSTTGVTKLARRLVAVAAMAALAWGFGGAPRYGWPPGMTAVVYWVADHDMVDVPYVRDCHGLYRRPAECPSPADRPARSSGASGLSG